MFSVKPLLYSLLVSTILYQVRSNEDVYQGMMDPEGPQLLLPKVFVGMLVRNKAHTLPYFLYYLENLDYPKDRMILWIKSDHNSDNSTAIVQEWLQRTQSSYHKVYAYVDDEEESYEDEKGPCHWSDDRFKNVIALRQEILDTARGLWADYAFFVDVDNILVNKDTLMRLIAARKTVVAPMLNTTLSEWYSNFWGGMDKGGFYVRTDDYKLLVQRQAQGCYPVANVHSTFLIDLNCRRSRLLAFDPPHPGYAGPLDDVIQFARNAQHHRVPLHVLNDDFFGWMPIPMEAHNSISQEADQFAHIKIENIIYDRPLQQLPYVYVPTPRPTKLGFDQIYIINLKRRPDRRVKMEAALRELGLKALTLDAVDGRALNDSYLAELGVAMLPGYADPYQGRKMTMGEIGCFLSHYFIWQDVLKHGHGKVLVFEDDLRFEPYFKYRLTTAMGQMRESGLDWDLMYLGRKKLAWQDETWVADLLVRPHYSYWTLSYALSQEGAHKLLAQKPLAKLIPVDEYLPIMFDKHPEYEWKAAFSPRDLVALSVEPLLVYPTHYTGEPGYITDTEDSSVLAEDTGDTGDMPVLSPSPAAADAPANPASAGRNEL